jgi:hypothetical protein
MLKFLALQAALHIYNISRLRVKLSSMCVATDYLKTGTGEA